VDPRIHFCYVLKSRSNPGESRHGSMWPSTTRQGMHRRGGYDSAWRQPRALFALSEGADGVATVPELSLSRRTFGPVSGAHRRVDGRSRKRQKLQEQRLPLSQLVRTTAPESTAHEIYTSNTARAKPGATVTAPPSRFPAIRRIRTTNESGHTQRLSYRERSWSARFLARRP